ncbi:MAG: phosphoribosylglycinamide formyltransferase [Betaproteobacteria bacterium]|jgi:phosphoribosylglycinamide formyltransferase 1
MKNIVILISGGGSNMKSIVKRAQKAQWLERFQTQIGLVLSNNPLAQGLEWAQQQGLPTAVVDHRHFHQDAHPRRAFEEALIQRLEPHQPELLVLAGFMRILSPFFVSHYANKVMNIHPSLLPAFTGLHTHQRAIQAGVKFSGASVHWVSEELDAGHIIDQALVPLLPDDTPNSLATRVLTQEHLLYPRVIENWLKTQTA